MNELTNLLEKYQKYINDNKIVDYFDFNFSILKKNIVRFNDFLELNTHANNDAYYYFRCVYYFCKEEYNYILRLIRVLQESNYYNLLGYYHHIIKHDYPVGERYYKMAIELGNSFAMVNYGIYYLQPNVYFNDKTYLHFDDFDDFDDFIDFKGFGDAEEYYINAVKYNNPNACLALARNYRCNNQFKNTDLMIKYYLKGIELKNTRAMQGLASYYYEKNDEDLMIKYNLMAIKLGDVFSMNKLASYYQYYKKNYDLMEKYYVMAINLGYAKSMHNLAHYYGRIQNFDLMKKYYIMAIHLNYKLSIQYFKNYCEIDEGCILKYYEYVNYPKILTLILCNRKVKLFLPDELLHLIYIDYMQ